MKVGVIGSGGREHAICISLQKSKNIEKIYCFPGNAGTSFIAENIEIELNNFEKIKRVIKELGIDIIIVGPTIIMSIPSSLITLFNFSKLLSSISIFSAIKLVPAFPGKQ